MDACIQSQYWHQIVQEKALLAIHADEIARRLRLEHDRLAHDFKDWDIQARYARFF